MDTRRYIYIYTYLGTLIWKSDAVIFNYAPIFEIGSNGTTITLNRLTPTEEYQDIRNERWKTAKNIQCICEFYIFHDRIHFTLTYIWKWVLHVVELSRLFFDYGVNTEAYTIHKICIADLVVKSVITRCISWWTTYYNADTLSCTRKYDWNVEWCVISGCQSVHVRLLWKC
jgi:hypothetical protein